MMKYFGASNHNIPEAARKILAAMNYFDLSLVTAPVPSHGGANHGASKKPSERFSTYQCNDAMISIASSAKDKPITVTIAKTDKNGISEDILFHFDPVKKMLLTARQTEDPLGEGL